MKTYTIGITHHSIASAREITVTGTLTQAKRQATKEFGGEFQEYRIVIQDSRGETVASKLVGAERWS